MRLEFLTILMGILAASIYGLSWLFQAMEWPGAEHLKIAAILPFLAGVIMLALYNIEKRKESDRFDDSDSWEE
ncbi:MAG: hypothetical protein AAF570_08525 [Bacteroidota bacterium]